LAIGHGEVIDTYGNRSSQTDVVIVNEDHPFTFSENRPGKFFVEGVVAGGEIKSTLTGKELKDAISKSKAFKQLTVNSRTRLMWKEFPYEDTIRFHQHRAYFLVAMESQLTLSTIERRLVEAADQEGIHPYGLLDVVLIVETGEVLVNLGKGNGVYQARSIEGEVARGWTTFSNSSGLFHFLGWLSSVTPRETHWPSILTSYLLDEKPE
jgi:hypothetical protein